MSLKVKDNQLFKTYNKIWKKNEILMRIDFDSKPTYKKYIKAKIKTYEDSIIIIFCNEKGSKKVPEEKIPCIRLSITILDSVLYAYEKYPLQTFLEERKYKQQQQQQQQQQKKYIDEELKSESDTDTDIDTDNEEQIKKM